MQPRILQLQTAIAATLIFTQLFKTSYPTLTLVLLVVTFAIMLKTRKDLALALLFALLAFVPALRSPVQSGFPRGDFELHGTILHGPIFHPKGCQYLVKSESGHEVWRVSTSLCSALPNDKVEAFLRPSTTRPFSAMAVDFYSRSHRERFSLRRSVAMERSRWIQKTHALSDPGLLIALTTGNTSFIPEARMDFFRDLGISHLLAVSGLHFGILAALLWGLFGLIANRFPTLILRYKKKKMVAPFVLFSLFLFLLFVGAPISATRAFLMVGAYIVSTLFSRYLKPSIALMYALCAILFFHPANIENMGFQLSFCALIGILAVLNNRAFFAKIAGGHPRLEKLITLSFVSIAAGLATLPILLHHTGQISWISFPANLIVVPLFSALVFPALLCAAFLFRSESFLAPLGEFLLNQFSKLSANFVDQFTFLVLLSPSRSFPGRIPLWSASVVFILTICVLYYLSTLRKTSLFAALLTILALLYFTTPKPNEGLYVHFIDVGQGDSILIQTPKGRNILIDTGGSLYGRDPGQRSVAPFLKRKGIGKLDAILITHDDHDHNGGLDAIIRTIRVDRIIDNLDESAYLEDIGFEVYQMQSPEASKNNRSIVTLFRYGENCVLLSGDIEREAEEMLAEKIAHCSVLKIPHHGSKTSSSEPFLNSIRPLIGIVSAGRKNRFGHPHQSVLSRLEDHSIDIYSTQELGNISIVLFKNGSIRISANHPRQ